MTPLCSMLPAAVSLQKERLAIRSSKNAWLSWVTKYAPPRPFTRMPPTERMWRQRPRAKSRLYRAVITRRAPRSILEPLRSATGPAFVDSIGAPEKPTAVELSASVVPRPGTAPLQLLRELCDQIHQSLGGFPHPVLLFEVVGDGPHQILGRRCLEVPAAVRPSVHSPELRHVPSSPPRVVIRSPGASRMPPGTFRSR